MPITSSTPYPLALPAPPCSDVMSKQMKAIRNGRQSQQLPRPPPAAFGKQTKLLATNKSSRPFKLRSKRASLPPFPSPQTMRGIKNYLQQLPSSSTLLKRDSSRQQQQWRQRVVDFSIRLSAALIFPWKSSRREAQLRPRHAVIRLNENPNVNARMCKHTSVSLSLPLSLCLSLFLRLSVSAKIWKIMLVEVVVRASQLPGRKNLRENFAWLRTAEHACN